MDLASILTRLDDLETDLATCLSTTAPSMPLSCVATLAMDGLSASISFTTPTSDGGSPITGYTVTATPGGGVASGATSPLVVTGIDGNVEAYTFEVRASNAVGHSVPCVTNAVGEPQIYAPPICTNILLRGSILGLEATYSRSRIDKQGKYSLTTNSQLKGTINIFQNIAGTVSYVFYMDGNLGTYGYDIGYDIDIDNDIIAMTAIPGAYGIPSGGTARLNILEPKTNPTHTLDHWTVTNSIVIALTYQYVVIDGDTILNNGYEYRRISQGVWTGPTPIGVAFTPANNNWGQLALSGNTAAYGFPGRTVSGQSTAGQVEIWKRTGTTWSLEATISNPSAQTGDNFGISVALDGDILIVQGSLAAWMYRRTGVTWSLEFQTFNQAGASGPDVQGTTASLGGSVGFQYGDGKVKVVQRQSPSGIWLPVHIGAYTNQPNLRMTSNVDTLLRQDKVECLPSPLAPLPFTSPPGSIYYIAGPPTSFPKALVSTDGLAWSDANLVTNLAGSYADYTCVATNGAGAWVATASTGSSKFPDALFYSENGGEFWYPLGSHVMSGGCRGVAYGGGTWVAVGKGHVNALVKHTIAYSTDGKTWTGLGTAIFTTEGVSVAYSGSVFVATGTGTNTVATSPNGITWTGQGSPFAPSGLTRHGIAYGDGAFIACTNSGLSRSTNLGITWTAIPISGMTTVRSIVYNGRDLWLALGGANADTSAYARSYDGVTFVASNRSRIFEAYDAAYDANADYTVLVGLKGTGTDSILVTRDGEAFLSRGSVGLSQHVKYIAANQILPVPETQLIYVAGGSGTNALAWSKNGITWNAVASSPLTSCSGVGYNGASLWVAVGAGGSHTISTSADGKTWAGQGTTVFATEGRVVVHDGVGLWVAGGTGPAHTQAHSTNGTTWTGDGNATFSLACNGIAHDGVGNWVAVGSGGNSVATSTNGTVWTPSTNLFSTAGHGVAYSGNHGRFVAVGNGAVHSVAYSDNGGSTWTGLGLTIFTSCHGIAYNGVDLWVAVGAGPNSIAWSNDGVTWTGVTGTTIFNTRGTSVAYDGTLRRWVVTGVGSVHTMAWCHTSTITSWTGLGLTTLTVQGNAVSASHTAPTTLSPVAFVACGDLPSTLAYSRNGVEWVGAPATPFSSSARHAAYDGIGLWVAGGQGATHTLATSTDGINWTGRGNTIFTSCHGVATDGLGNWVAGGQGTHRVARSTDGINWTGNGTTIFGANGCLDVAYDPTTGRFLVTGQGPPNDLAYSTNAGVTWTSVGTGTGLGDGIAMNRSSKTLITVGGGGSSIGVSRSTDGGSTWTTVNSAVFGGPATQGVTDVATDGFGRWEAVCVNTGGGHTLAYSNDDGLTWVGYGLPLSNGGNGITYHHDLDRFVATGNDASFRVKYRNNKGGAVWTGGLGLAGLFTTNVFGVAPAELLPRAH